MGFLEKKVANEMKIESILLNSLRRISNLQNIQERFCEVDLLDFTSFGLPTMLKRKKLAFHSSTGCENRKKGTVV